MVLISELVPGSTLVPDAVTEVTVEGIVVDGAGSPSVDVEGGRDSATDVGLVID